MGPPWRIVIPHTQSLTSLDEVRVFLDGNASVSSTAPIAEERYRWLGATLRQFRYDAPVFGDRTYALLATISVAPVQPTRQCRHRRQRGDHEPTRPCSVAVGERRTLS